MISKDYLLLGCITFFTFFCLIRWLGNLVSAPATAGPQRVKERLRVLKGLDAGSVGATLLKTPEWGQSFGEQFLSKIQFDKKIRAVLIQAELPWKAGTFLLIDLLAGVLALALGFWKWGPLGGLAGAGLGLFLPYKLLLAKKKRRLKKFEKLLPDALDLLARSLKAGHSLAAGMQLVAKEMTDPVGSEFLTTYQEYSHGLDLSGALINLCNRVDLRDLGFFATAVLIQRETGGNLTEILEKIAMLIRERFKLRNQIKALTAEGRFSGLVLVLLPPLLAGILFVVNPEYESLLVQHRVGRIIALVALGFQLLGIIAIRKIVNIKI
jgi:tight adherence protein B